MARGLFLLSSTPVTACQFVYLENNIVQPIITAPVPASQLVNIFPLLIRSLVIHRYPMAIVLIPGWSDHVSHQCVLIPDSLMHGTKGGGAGALPVCLTMGSKSRWLPKF